MDVAKKMLSFVYTTLHNLNNFFPNLNNNNKKSNQIHNKQTNII